MIKAAAENKEINRNLPFFKKIGKPVLCDDKIDDILERGISNQTTNIHSRRFSRKPNYLVNKRMCSCLLHYLSSSTGIIIMCSNYFSILERIDL